MATSTEIAEYDVEELERQLNETRRELFNLRFQLATGQLDNSTRIGHVKKDIARMLTELRNREIAEAEGLALEQMPAHVAAARRRREDEALGRERSTPAERRAAARAAEDEAEAEAQAGHADHTDDVEDLADGDEYEDDADDAGEDEEIARADDDGMGEAIGDAVPDDDDDDEDGST
jgi:large subunit ribosomal protein L29